jgi:integrase
MDYKLGRLNGECVLTYWIGGKRHRFRLGTSDPREAAIRAPGIFSELSRPKGQTVGELWTAFEKDMAGRAIASILPYNWKALASRFANMQAAAITIEDCRAYTKERSEAGMKPGTICTELGRLRMCLNWAVKRKLLDRAPHIERPSPPKRKEDYLTRQQARALINAAELPHLRLYVVLALGTGARNAALLDLTWDRVDFERGLIDLRNPKITAPHKGRAIVPMNRAVRAALQEAKTGALSAFVIEWAGAQVGSVKKGLAGMAKRAGVGHASPHMLRHSAAVHMAEAGISMEEIAQFLGHDDVNTTRRVYARFSPNFLKEAAAVLEYDDFGSRGSTNQGALPKVPVSA